MYFGELNIVTNDKHHEFEVRVHFAAINPDTVQVELYAEGMNGESPILHKMVAAKKIEGSDNGHL